MMNQSSSLYQVLIHLIFI